MKNLLVPNSLKIAEIKTGSKMINSRTQNIWTCVLVSKQIGFRKKVMKKTYCFISKTGREIKLQESKLMGLIIAGVYIIKQTQNGR